MEGKNLDTLFQEKLKNLEVTPNKNVWNAIESKLKRKPFKILPIWWFFGEIAALFILVFLFFTFPKDPVLENKTNTEPTIVVAPEETPTNPVNAEEKPTDTIFKKNNNQKEIRITKNKPIQKNKIKKQQPFQESNFLIAEQNQQNSEKESKGLVSKKAMEKIFLADKSIPDKKVKADSILNTTKKNEIQKPKKEFLATVKKEEKKEEKSRKKQWTIAPVFAVLSSNSFTNTSPIDENLSKSTQGNSTYSYGVQVSYQLADKWTLQSGIHLQEIGFSNNQVAVVSSASNSSSTIAFNTNESYTFQNVSNQSFNANSISLTNLRSFNGNLSQKYGYIEIPVEVKYNLLESKKFTTQIVAGFSSLFLNKNEVDVSTGSFSRKGEANNLNNINFSGNLGLDFNYDFGKNWSLHLNPMIKTQLNTFSENANGFKPYFVGIYTGIHFRF